MHVSLKTKFTLIIALFVLAVVAVIATVFSALWTRQVLADARDRAQFVARQVYFQAQHALEEAAFQGSAPASSSPEDVREYVRQVLDEDAGITRLVNGVSEIPAVYEVSVVDYRGLALISSDSSQVGQPLPPRESLATLAEADFLEQLGTLYGPPTVFEHRLPFNLAGDFFGDIRVGLSSALLRNQVAGTLRSGILLAGVAVLISTLLAAVVSHLALAPLASISRQLESISKGAFDVQPVQVRRGDELGQLSTQIDQLGRQLREQSFRSEEERSLEHIRTQVAVLKRLAALARVTAGAAHEVKNPLNSMRLWLENLKDSQPGSGAHHQAIKVLDAEIDRLDGVVKRLLEFYRPVELDPQETDLAGLLEEVLTVVRPETQRRQVKLETAFAPGVPPVRVDRQMVKEAVLNLVLNACQAMEAGGTLTLGLERNGQMARVMVADTGPGIPPEHRDRVFQLFFTTRKGGTGIGLASTFRVVQLHGGSIDFTSEAGRGTTFRVELPLAA